MDSKHFDRLVHALPLLQGNDLRIALLHLFYSYAEKHDQLDTALQLIDCTVDHSYGINVHLSLAKPAPWLATFIQDIPFFKTIQTGSSPYFMNGCEDPEQYNRIRQKTLAENPSCVVDPEILFPRFTELSQRYASIFDRIDRCLNLDTMVDIYRSKEYIGYIMQHDFGWPCPLEWSSSHHAIVDQIHQDLSWIDIDNISVRFGSKSSTGSSDRSLLCIGQGYGTQKIPLAIYKSLSTVVRGITQSSERWKMHADYDHFEVSNIILGPVGRSMQDIIDNWRIASDDSHYPELYDILRNPVIGTNDALDASFT